MSTLETFNLQKSYKGRQVVKNATFTIEAGKVVGLLGPNGAGKTTSFYMVVGLVRPDHGNIKLNGEDVTHLPMHQRAKLGIGYLPQEASIFRQLSVEKNILAILERRNDLNKKARQEKLEQLLEEFQITHIRSNTGMSLSGGERRRVEIARSLAMDPAFVLLDEPFAGVDPISVIDIQNIIKQLISRNIGVLITDHNVRETLGICHSAYILSNGEVIAEGQPEIILQNQVVRDVYLGDNFTM